VTTVRLNIHLEEADGEACWWADSADLPGFTAAGPTLGHLRELAGGTLRDVVGPDVQLTEHLVGGPLVTVELAG
jgi:hypothetical protein